MVVRTVVDDVVVVVVMMVQDVVNFETVQYGINSRSGDATCLYGGVVLVIWLW